MPGNLGLMSWWWSTLKTVGLPVFAPPSLDIVRAICVCVCVYVYVCVCDSKSKSQIKSTSTCVESAGHWVDGKDVAKIGIVGVFVDERVGCRVNRVVLFAPTTFWAAWTPKIFPGQPVTGINSSTKFRNRAETSASGSRQIWLQRWDSARTETNYPHLDRLQAAFPCDGRKFSPIPSWISS
jgi:hypothetical protein